MIIIIIITLSSSSLEIFGEFRLMIVNAHAYSMAHSQTIRPSRLYLYIYLRAAIMPTVGDVE